MITGDILIMAAFGLGFFFLYSIVQMSEKHVRDLENQRDELLKQLEKRADHTEEV